jgi:hypothetical protein
MHRPSNFEPFSESAVRRARHVGETIEALASVEQREIHQLANQIVVQVHECLCEPMVAL